MSIDPKIRYLVCAPIFVLHDLAVLIATCQHDPITPLPHYHDPITILKRNLIPAR